MGRLHSTSRVNLCGAQWRRSRSWRMTAGVAGLGLLALAAEIRAQAAPPKAVPAPPSYAGVWFDDTGQGAVEIGPCAERLCGHIVWLRSPLDKAGRPLTDGNNPDARQRQRPICGLPVIGDLKRQRTGSWDEGWIYDPKQGKQFDVELRLQAADALKVTGYLGIKLLSETFVWRRAPADLKRCA